MKEKVENEILSAGSMINEDRFIISARAYVIDVEHCNWLFIAGDGYKR